jgi:hypothetical protein
MQAEVDQNPAVRIARAFARGIGGVEGILCILFSSILFLVGGFLRISGFGLRISPSATFGVE